MGKKDYFYNRLEEKIEKDKIKNVLLAGFVPDNDLEFVYRNSMAYIFPSLYEGFGLPPLEAMSKGVAVASSDHGCMREVLGDSAHFFNGKDKQSIIGAIFKIINDDKLRADLIKRGFQRIN